VTLVLVVILVGSIIDFGCLRVGSDSVCVGVRSHGPFQSLFDGTFLHLPADWNVKWYSQIMKIGDLAQAAGVNTKTIRYYEDIGVLPPAERAPNGYRTYDQDAVERVRFIREAQATGLSLDEITSVLELREQGASTCHHVLDLLEHHLTQLDDRIAALESTRGKLEVMIERARRLDPADCTDPARCQTIVPQSAVGSNSMGELHGAPLPHRH
jgi:DNA-binding transcriptional MerR regulator